MTASPDGRRRSTIERDREPGLKGDGASYVIYGYVILQFALGIAGAFLGRRLARDHYSRRGWPVTGPYGKDSYPVGMFTFAGWGCGMGLGAAVILAALITWG